jgi:acetylornithine deacetylase/succinyl-diaminopimelate desuccinylase-like protein
MTDLFKFIFFAAPLTLMLAGALSAGPAAAQGGAVDAATTAVLADAKVVKALDAIKADDARALSEQKTITEIPAPPFKEKVRGTYLLKRFQELGFKDAAMDTEGNVIALRKGSGGTPKLVISAHQDTVFAEGTDVTVKEKDGMILAPGIGDDARGLAALLSLMQSLNDSGITTVGDIMFVATVG